jgi:PPOX class probable F420-dependent enzyme
VWIDPEHSNAAWLRTNKEEKVNTFDILTRQQYLNIETFRKSGVGVKTPVWFVQDGNTVFVRTVANSGKVKRIRNNPNVNITPCKVDGALLGEWIPAAAHEVRDSDTDRKVNRLLDEKYGLVKKMFGLVSMMQGRKDTVLEIKLRE